MLYLNHQSHPHNDAQGPHCPVAADEDAEAGGCQVSAERETENPWAVHKEAGASIGDQEPFSKFLSLKN